VRQKPDPNPGQDTRAEWRHSKKESLNQSLCSFTDRCGPQGNVSNSLGVSNKHAGNEHQKATDHDLYGGGEPW
jgi:hypothetical protein